MSVGTRAPGRASSSETPLISESSERRLVALALASLYLIWGSTYLGMRIALETFPPFLLGGLRYTLAGALLYGWLRLRGVTAPSWREWRHATMVGTLLFAIGNGFVAYAERTISSGVAAVVIATVSLWSVLFAAFWGTRPRRGELVGLALGFLGVFLLQRGGAFGDDVSSALALVIAPIGWAFGSQWGARLSLPRGPMASAVQMFGGGLSMLLIGVVSRERFSAPTLPALLAFAYLVTLGSLVAFSAYQYLLTHTRPALATSYSFVNPAVALLLGAALVGEPLDAGRVAACALTGLAVVFVLRAKLPATATATKSR